MQFGRLLQLGLFMNFIIESMKKKPNKAINYFWLFLLYIVGMINRAFLVPFPTIDSLSIQNIMQLSETDKERYHREVKNVIYRMVLMAVIAGTLLLIWLL